MRTVRDAAFEVLRQQGLTRIFANPGSTEVALLADLPDDLDFVLGLHEGSVVGMASGYALATGSPALVLLHTTAGFGNAVGAIATARTNKAPLVILVGQQDRRHVASEPFLAGHLDGLAGAYAVSSRQPARAADVPAAIARAAHEAALHRGPAVVVVPMSDWAESADDTIAVPAPVRLRVCRGVDEEVGAELAAVLDGASNPVLVVGPGADSADGWAGLGALADRLDCPVWQEAHGSQAGFPQDSSRFRGHLPAGRAALRDALAPHDVVLVAGGPAFRQGTWEQGHFVTAGTTVLVVTADPEEATYSAAHLAVVGDVARVMTDLAERVAPRHAPEAQPPRSRMVLPPQGSLRAEHVFAALADRLPEEATVFEESPSSRRLLLDLMPTRRPFGFVTVAQGGLGFALPASIGVRMARPNRPVVALLGDGASLYNIQGLWSAQHYRVGALFVVLSNGGYAVMDRLAAGHGGKPPWPAFTEVSVSTIAAGFGCATSRVTTHDELTDQLDRILPTLGERTEPLLLEVVVEATA
ncbi:thiamine pyrophosphate-binding protein [Knoellia sp. S7-12]|uniref:thiamine pyrophosphate-binding protein n=1 Tax=Knoellia sp. S7-12 TaxID=3126698 RepID=UPI00336871B8